VQKKEVKIVTNQIGIRLTDDIEISDILIIGVGRHRIAGNNCKNISS
jgi:hypothetical protein